MKESENVIIWYTANCYGLLIQFGLTRCKTYGSANERKEWKEDFSMKVPSREFHREFIKYLKENGAFAPLMSIIFLEGKSCFKAAFAHDCLSKNENCGLVGWFPHFGLPALSINEFVMILKNKQPKN